MIERLATNQNEGFFRIS